MRIVDITASLVTGFVIGMLAGSCTSHTTQTRALDNALFRAEQAELELILLEEKCDFIGEDDE